MTDIFTPLFNEGRHVSRPLRGEVHLQACRGMDESQRAGMEHLTRTELEAVLDIGLITGSPFATEDFRSTIAFVAEQRMADVLHVGSDLVGAPRFEDTLYQRDVAIAFKHLVMSDGRFTYL